MDDYRNIWLFFYFALQEFFMTSLTLGAHRAVLCNSRDMVTRTSTSDITVVGQVPAVDSVDINSRASTCLTI